MLLTSLSPPTPQPCMGDRHRAGLGSAEHSNCMHRSWHSAMGWQGGCQSFPPAHLSLGKSAANNRLAALKSMFQCAAVTKDGENCKSMRKHPHPSPAGRSVILWRCQPCSALQRCQSGFVSCVSPGASGESMHSCGTVQSP